MPYSNFNVLFITHLSSRYTGANRSLISMIDGLQKKGVKAIVVMPKSHDMTLKEELDKIGIDSYVLRYFMPVYPKSVTIKEKLQFLPKWVRSLLLNYVVERTLIQIIKERKVNIIHTNVGPLFLGYNVAKKLNIYHVWHLREFQDIDFNLRTWTTKNEFKIRISEPKNYPIAISEAVYRHFELKPPAKVIYNGVLRVSETQFISDKEDYFLFVGFLIETKGIGNLLTTFATFAKTHSKFKLLIAGYAPDITYLNKLKNIILGNNISDRVVFLCKRDDVSNLMSRAVALLVPSLNEAFGRITAEAMFNGCLVIGKNTGGTKEIIDKIGVGILYNDNDDLLESLNMIATKGLNSYYSALIDAKELAAANFSEEQNAELVYSYYEAIFNNHI